MRTRSRPSLRAALRPVVLACAPFAVGAAGAAGAVGAVGAAGQEGWSALPPPSWVGPGPAALAVLPSWHLFVDGYEPAPRQDGQARLALPLLCDLLEDQAERGGATLAVRPEQPLLARGSPAELSRAAATLSALEAAGLGLALELDVRLVPGAPDSAGAPGRGRPALCLGAAESARLAPRSEGSIELARRRVLSGDAVDVDAGATRGFVSGFDIDVASGVVCPVPRLGALRDGLALRLRAWRWRDGAAVLLAGAIDVAREVEGVHFDPGAPDLGRVELPAVDVARLHFSGVIESGGMLRLGVAGGPRGPAGEAWTLEIRARAAPAAPPHAAAGSRGAWRIVDWQGLAEGAAHGAERWSPEPVVPGFGLASPLERFGVPAPALGAAGAWSEVEGALLRGASGASGAAGAGRPTRPLVAVSPALIVLPAGETAVALLGELQSALESAASSTAEVELELGGARAWLPCARGLATAAWIGRERLALVGYAGVLAQDAASAEPLVAPLFDGALWSGAWDGAALAGSAWLSSTSEMRLVEQRDGVQGRLQLPVRALAAGRTDTGAGEMTMLPPLGTPGGAPGAATASRVAVQFVVAPTVGG